MSDGEARRPAHLAVARAVLIAPFGALASMLAGLAYDATKRAPLQLDYAWAGAVTTAALLVGYLLVEELARGRARWRALLMFVAFAAVHALLLYPVLGALWEHVLGWTPRAGGDWPLLDVWASAVEQLRQHWSRDHLRVPALLAGVPLVTLGVARAVLQLPGWAQPLVVVAAALAGGAAFGALLSRAAGYPPEAWGAVIASSAVLHAPAWAATPVGLRVGDRAAPWLIARLAADLAADRSRP